LKRTTRPGSVFLVAGTRPEIIKLAPLYRKLQAEIGEARTEWISTGQHLDLERTTLESFGIVPAMSLDIRALSDDLLDAHAEAVKAVTRLITERRPALVIVQGDTLSAVSTAFAAFHAQTPLAHVEAGLRSGNTHNPFPEEAYRRMIDALADLRFAPTRQAADNLLAEKMRPKTIFVTGNTAVDALMENEARPPSPPAMEIREGAQLVLVTLHRRESWGHTLEQMCHALIDIADRHPDVEIVLPLHINPKVRDTIRPILRNNPQIRVTAPLSYADCHDLMRRAALILTDSGGIQEEAPSYGVPTLVLRETTERPEVLLSGQALLVGTDRNKIVAEASRLLSDAAARAAMRGNGNPFGDGKAAGRIAKAVRRFLEGETVLLTAEEQFSSQRDPVAATN